MQESAGTGVSHCAGPAFLWFFLLPGQKKEEEWASKRKGKEVLQKQKKEGICRSN
jgi:hypothetical protein